MRDREPALLHRLREIVDTVSVYGIPVVANGDCWGAKDRERICDLTGVTSIMIARGAEANPSCFHASKSLQDAIQVIVPRYARIAHHVNNPFGNTKYCLNAMDFSGSNSGKGRPGSKERRKQLKIELSRVKSYEGLFELLELDKEEEVSSLDELLPGLRERLAKEDREIATEVREELAEMGKEEPEEEDDEEFKHKRPPPPPPSLTTTTSNDPIVGNGHGESIPQSSLRPSPSPSASPSPSPSVAVA